jgi:hypothetical protein
MLRSDGCRTMGQILVLRELMHNIQFKNGLDEIPQVSDPVSASVFLYFKYRATTYEVAFGSVRPSLRLRRRSDILKPPYPSIPPVLILKTMFDGAGHRLEQQWCSVVRIPPNLDLSAISLLSIKLVM